MSELFRHYKGGYFLSHGYTTLKSEITPGRNTAIVLEPLFEGERGPSQNLLVIPIPDLNAEAPKEGNTFNQKCIWEQMKHFSNILLDVSTEALVAELNKRPDNPYRDVDLPENKPWLEEYHLGLFWDRGEDNTSKTDDNLSFETRTIAADAKEAAEMIERNPSLSGSYNFGVLRVASYRVDPQSFDFPS